MRAGVRLRAALWTSRHVFAFYGNGESFDITEHTSVNVLSKDDRKTNMTELTAAHIRAARALLEWTQPELAAAAKLSVPTVRRMESERGPSASTAANVEAVRRALEAAGVIFLQAGQNVLGGVGVRLRK